MKQIGHPSCCEQNQVQTCQKQTDIALSRFADDFQNP